MLIGQQQTAGVIIFHYMSRFRCNKTCNFTGVIYNIGFEDAALERVAQLAANRGDEVSIENMYLLHVSPVLLDPTIGNGDTRNSRRNSGSSVDIFTPPS
jgi:hypothetical protein